jgi:hypothetical protein
MAKEEFTGKQPIKHHYRKYLRYFGIFAGVLLLLQLFFYFASDFLLRNYLKEKVREVSGEKYVVDFDRFRISLLQRGISFYGFSMTPVEENFKLEDGLPYYKISIPEVHIRRLNYLFRKKEVVVGKISMTNPLIDFRFNLMEPEMSQLEVLQDQIKRSFLGTSIQEIRIKSLLIFEGDLLLKNFIAQRAMKAENAGFELRDVQLLQKRIPETPFNSGGFEFNLTNFEILLADSVHTIQAGKVMVSSIKQAIKAKDLSITPDFNRKAQQYFEVSLEDLELTDADINKVFYTAEVEVGKLVLDKPDFHLFSAPKVQAGGDIDVFDLYQLIEGMINSVSIRELLIDEGKFIQYAIADPGKHNLKAERLEFKMQNFYVGPEKDKKLNQFFYAENAALELYQVDLALGDKVHWIQGGYVKLSSFEDAIKIDDFKLFPLFEIQQDENRTLLNIDVAELSITESQLKKIYNEGILDIREIIVDQPQILLRDIQSSSGKEKGAVDLKAIIGEYLKAIYVSRFEIREGSLILDNNLRVRQDSLSFGKVSLVLENFALDEKTEDSENKGIFWADHLQLELSDYALKLSDDLHVFKASKVNLDTRRNEIKIDGFTIKPFEQYQIQNALDRYDKNLTLDIYVPQFIATGVDIPRAYFSGVLTVNQIKVPSPKINLTRYRNKTDGEDSGDQKDVLRLLTSYFSSVSVDSLILQKGSINYQNNFGDRLRTFSEENVSIAVKSFHIDQNTDAEEVKFLFSEEVDLSLNNYVFNIADGKYTLTADRINFNTALEEIRGTNVRLKPSSRLGAKTKVSAFIPTMSFKGVDLEAFLFENTLSLEKVRLSGSEVNVLINKDTEQETSTGSRRPIRERTLPKNIEIVLIDTIEANNAILNLTVQEDGVRNELINSGINLRFYEFILDSTRIQKGDIPGFFTGMALGIDEFWLNLKDSLHQITFSKVELDTRYEGVLLDNFRIIPRNLSGKPGIPVFSGHIPTVLMKINSLADIQSSKDLWIKELRLFKPDIEVFVDQVKPAEKKKFNKPAEFSMLENLRIDDFEIIDGNFTVFDKLTAKAPQAFNNLNLELSDFEIELENLQGLTRAELLKKDFKLSFPNYNVLLKDSLNKLSIGLITLSNQEILLQDFQMMPRFGNFEYTRKVGVQTDVSRIRIPEIRISRADMEALFEQQKLIAPLLVIQSPEAEFFRDKRAPQNTDMHRYMPQVLMQQSGLEVSIDSVLLRNGKISYAEFPEKGMVPGNLFFNEIEIGMFPFHLVKEGRPYPMNESFLIANMNLNGQAPLSVQGQLFFNPPYPIHLNAQLGAFDLQLINSILEANAFVRVTDGQVQGADWSFIANDIEAIGKMTILYQNLNLELLDERTLERGRGRKGMLTFVLNTFAVKSQNPRKILRKPLTTRIYEPRDQSKFVFNYWWKATLSGLQGSLGLGQPKVPRRKED